MHSLSQLHEEFDTTVNLKALGDSLGVTSLSAEKRQKYAMSALKLEPNFINTKEHSDWDQEVTPHSIVEKGSVQPLLIQGKGPSSSGCTVTCNC